MITIISELYKAKRALYMKTMKITSRIEVDQEICRGKPCIEGTRLRVSLILV